MATLRFQVQGELGKIILAGFMDQINAHLWLLQEYDLAISRRQSASVEWLITDIIERKSRRRNGTA